MNKFEYVQSYFYLNPALVSDSPVFFHIGTFTGKLEKLLTKRYPNCRIISIEANAANFALLVKNTQNMGNVMRINAALTCDDRKEVFMQGAGEAARTYMQSKGEAVPAVNLGNLIEEHDIKHVDAIFVNAEGIEMELVPYIINMGLFKIIKQFCVSFHKHVKSFKITDQSIETMLIANRVRDYYHIEDGTNVDIEFRSQNRLCHLFHVKQ